MPISNRAVTTAGLGLAAMLGLAVSSAFGQQADPQVQRSNAGNGAGASAGRAAATAMSPAVIAAVDMEKVINEYDRYKESSETFKAEAMKKQTELEALLQEAKAFAEKRDQFAAGTPDYQKYSDSLTDTQAKFEAQKQKIAAEFTLRESNAVAEIYNDIRYVIGHIAKNKGITFVVQVGPNENISGSNPDEVMAAVARNVVYHDPSADITDTVITTLNSMHKQRGGQVPAAPNPAAAPAQAPAGGGR